MRCEFHSPESVSGVAWEIWTVADDLEIVPTPRFPRKLETVLSWYVFDRAFALQIEMEIFPTWNLLRHVMPVSRERRIMERWLPESGSSIPPADPLGQP